MPTVRTGRPRVVSPFDGLAWWPSADECFLAPVTAAEVRALKATLKALPVGSTVPCRGRDYDGAAYGNDGENGEHGLTEWDLGVLVKHRGDALFFLYESGDCERFHIDAINFRTLVHPAAAVAAGDGGCGGNSGGGDQRPAGAAATANPTAASPLATACNNEELAEFSYVIANRGSSGVADAADASDAGGAAAGVTNVANVVVIAHGFSEEVGPNYALVRTLEATARRVGWRPIVPDFRSTYALPGRTARRRARARIVRRVLENLPAGCERVALVGHSQGGAACAVALEWGSGTAAGVAERANVCALLMLGSESPLQLDGMRAAPRLSSRSALHDHGAGCQPITIVHAEGDKVIAARHLRRVAQQWGAGYVELRSNVEFGAKDGWGDCIHHDFLAKDLMHAAVRALRAVLAAAAASPGRSG